VEVLAHWEQENRKRKWMSIDEALQLVTRPAILSMVTTFKLRYDTPAVAPVVKTEIVSQPEEKKINNEETGICVICMDKKIDTVILECAHSAVCIVCSGTLKICPICRGAITRVVKIFQV